MLVREGLCARWPHGLTLSHAQSQGVCKAFLTKQPLALLYEVCLFAKGKAEGQPHWQ